MSLQLTPFRGNKLSYAMWKNFMVNIAITLQMIQYISVLPYFNKETLILFKTQNQKFYNLKIFILTIFGFFLPHIRFRGFEWIILSKNYVVLRL